MLLGEERNSVAYYDGINIKNKKIITLGKCSRYYLLLLGSASFKFISLFLLGKTKNDIGLFGFCSVLTNFNFIQSNNNIFWLYNFWNYFFIF